MTFFGLTSEYRIHLFTQIHEIVFHGKGGYSWEDVYNMPIWLRKFTFNKINEFYEKEKEAAEGNKGMLTENSTKADVKKLARQPTINPDSTYKVKTPSK